MSRPSRLHALFAPLRRPFSSRSPSTPQRSRATRAVRLGLECLEERRVLDASWLGQIGGLGEELGSAVQVMDSAGNMYLNGTFQQTVDFDPGAGVMSLASAGGNDGFVAKYALDGTVQWARRFGGSATNTNNRYEDGVSSVAVDPAGQFVYATGVFSGSADFTGDGLPDAKADKAGLNDVFLVKLNAATGQTVWAKTLGSSYQDEANDVVTDGLSVYVTGSFSGSADFDPGPNTVTLTPAGKGNQRPSDAFVWKLDAAGNYAAAWQLGGTSADAGKSLALDGNALYLQGIFTGTVDFDPGPGVQSRTSVGGTNNFFARYTTAGALTWVDAIGNEFDDNFRMTADAGSLYLTGYFGGAIDFDPGAGTTLLDTGITNDGKVYDDAAIAKYAKADGSLAWARQFGGTQNEYGGVRSITDPTTGAVYFGMNSLSSTIDFTPGVPGGEFTNMSSDGFLVKLDANGNYLNAWQVGGPGYNGTLHPLGLINGTLYVTGSFVLTATFPTGGTLTSWGSRDLYLMAFDDPAAQPAASSLQIANATAEPQSGSAALAVENTIAKKDATRWAHEQVFESFAPEQNVPTSRPRLASSASRRAAWQREAPAGHENARRDFAFETVFAGWSI